MNTSSEKKQLKRAQSFLSTLGLSYDTLSPATQKYLLDLSGNHMNPETISGSVISQKFNSRLNTAISQNGGATSFPSEYFTNAPTSHYSTIVNYTQTSSLPDVTRAGLEHSGGLIKYNDFNSLKKAYEKRFIRQLNVNKKQQKDIINDLNKDIEKAVRKSINENPKRNLTKTQLKKNLK